MSAYALILILAGVVPLLLSFWPPLRFYQHGRALAATLGLILLIFGGWDVFAAYRGHWFFDPASVWPPRIINLPLEEVFFFIVIPFCCIFTWEILLFFCRKDKR
ncbi:MAG: lycopene cyclase domain-containing protein [Candidatus Omnitrophica bacterium]|nr:lycopene cyclase domain-containing protein [Candidatus Omnitrophota bacterium]